MLRLSRSRLLSSVILALAAPALLGAVDLRSNFEGRLLAAQNRERASLGIPAMAWDERLADEAKGWADDLAKTGRFEHSPDDPDAAQEGENLWAGTRDYYAPESMIALWTREKRFYRKGIFPNNSTSGRVEDVSHYTQLVWRDTRQVGCAMSTGQREDILVCRYSAAGNMIGESPL